MAKKKSTAQIHLLDQFKCSQQSSRMVEAHEEGTDRRSGSTRDKGKWKSKGSGRSVLGKTEALEDNVYRIGHGDQADLFIKTTEAIAAYVGVEFGWDLRILVKQRKEAGFTKPLYPTQTTGVKTRSKEDKEPAAAPSDESAQMAEYKVELGIYHSKVQKYNDDKAKVFVIILGQCTIGVQRWLEQGRGLDELEANRDVVGLLKLLEEMAFSNGGDQDPFIILIHSMRRLTTIQQGSREPIPKYYKRLKVSADVLNGHWGDFCPPNLIKDGLTKEEVKDRLLGRLLLVGADPVKFGPLKEELSNSYVSGIDRYPKTLEATEKLLSKYQATHKQPPKGDDNDERRGRSFAQKGKQGSPGTESPSRNNSPESATGEGSRNKKTDTKKAGRGRSRSSSPTDGWSSRGHG